MNWWRCHLCGETERNANAGQAWKEHYMTVHYKAVFSQVSAQTAHANRGYNEVSPRAANSGDVTDPFRYKETM